MDQTNTEMKKSKLDQNALQCFVMDGMLKGDRFLCIKKEELKEKSIKNLYNF